MSNSGEQVFERLLVECFIPPEFRGKSQAEIEEFIERERAEAAGFLTEEEKAEIKRRVFEAIKSNRAE